MKKNFSLALPGLIFILLLAESRLAPGSINHPPIQPPRPGRPSDTLSYFPLILKPLSAYRRVNAPFFAGGVKFSETAIFWFGRVDPTENYVDGRVGYNNSEIYIRLAAFDRLVWYDKTPSPDDLTAWDAFSLYLSLDGNTGIAPGMNAYRFDSQFNDGEARANWQAGYRGNGSTWIKNPLSFTTTSGYRGNGPNDAVDDRGWVMTFDIPFTSLGLSGPPPQGSIWGMGFELHDRDDASGTPIADKTWPETMNPTQPKTWGQLAFGLPAYTPPPAAPGGITTIRHKFGGATVTDAHVGGHSTCGQDYDPGFFDGWGDANYAGYDQFNIQNQADVADWPCFSKYYVTFPLDSIPPGKIIISATLQLHEFGNAGQGQQPPPQPSLIQVLTVQEDWLETKITWNNAPLAIENFSQAWVNPIDIWPGWPGVPCNWDISWAVASAYQSGKPLRLALYSADSAQNSGKYFTSSDTGDWNLAGRPTLRVTWGEPAWSK